MQLFIGIYLNKTKTNFSKFVENLRPIIGIVRLLFTLLEPLMIFLLQRINVVIVF